MDVFIIRHGSAEKLSAAPAGGSSEFARALTLQGAGTMQAVAEGLRGIAPDLRVIGHSPLRRAQQTAAIVAASYPQARQVTVDALRPGGEAVVLEGWLAGLDDGPAAVVGHEPDLGRWIARLLTGEPAAFVPLKKGGICCLRFAAEPRPGGAVLRWMLPPRVLRSLAPRNR